MRTPTPLNKQLAWWKSQLNGATPNGEFECMYPQPGFYKIRERAWSKNWLPARVWLHQEIDWETGELMEPEAPVVEISGRQLSHECGAHVLSPAEEAWQKMKPVTMDEWKWLNARAALHSTGIAKPASTSA